MDFEFSKLNTSVKVFEDLSKGYSDRYQYVLPDFNFSRNIPIPNNYNGNFSFNSYGYNKYYETNVAEAVIINDFLFSSNQFISKNGDDDEIALKATYMRCNNPFCYGMAI